jgi:uncharacterized membrane protein YphA (DoxX/SURF4 family)
MSIEKRLKPKTLLILRLFLAGTFIAQSIRAFSYQPDFLRLVSESPFLVFDFLTPVMFLTLVGIFDIVIAILLFWGIAVRAAAIHGFIWICLVMTNSLIIGRLLETVDSIGYLGGLIVLIIWGKDKFEL